VSNLRVTHETLGKSHRQRRGLKLSVALGVLVESVHDGGLGVGDGIAVLGAVDRGDAPTVNDDYKNAKTT
jgi:hypothetical protein